MKPITLIIYIALIFVFLSCANQKIPEGGPIDPTPPQIIYTHPNNGTLNFSDNFLAFEFDRYIDERTFEESFFISPSVGQYEFDWSGKEVKILFSNPLKGNTTYVVSIGTDVKDRYRNQKNLEHAFTLCFSTGNYLDNGYIEGRVFNAHNTPAAKLTMLAYNISEMNADTLNPSTTQPHFITSTGIDGTFNFKNIPFGSYRIFAIKDEYKNLLYDIETDEFALQSQPIYISAKDTLFKNINMLTCKEDTTRPKLIKVSSISKNHLIAEFSEDIFQESIEPSSINIVDTTNKNILQILHAYYYQEKKVKIITEEQDSAKVYSISFNKIKDLHGNNILSNANTLTFYCDNKNDLPEFKLSSTSIQDSITDVSIKPIIAFSFSDKISLESNIDSIILLDENNNSIEIEKSISNETINITPKADLQSYKKYKLLSKLYFIKSWNNKTCLDSVKIINFTTIDMDNLSSVAGTITDNNTNDKIGNIFIIATQHNATNPKTYTAVADNNGNFNFINLPEGEYTFNAFRDRNNNGAYDCGTPFPFTYSERLSKIFGPFKVRARWPLDGVNLLLE